MNSYIIVVYIILIICILSLLYIIKYNNRCLSRAEYFQSVNNTLIMSDFKIDIFGNISIYSTFIENPIYLSSNNIESNPPYTLRIKGNYLLLLKDKNNKTVNTIIFENYNNLLKQSDIYDYKFKILNNGELSILKNDETVITTYPNNYSDEQYLLYKMFLENDNINIYNNFDFLKYSFTVIKE